MVMKALARKALIPACKVNDARFVIVRLPKKASPNKRVPFRRRRILQKAATFIFGSRYQVMLASFSGVILLYLHQLLAVLASYQ